MKRVLFVWLIIFYLTKLTVSDDDSGDDDNGDNCDNIDDNACPCFPGYINDILGRCSDIVDGQDEDIFCEIDDSNLAGFGESVACFEEDSEFAGVGFLVGDFFGIDFCIQGTTIEVIGAILNFIKEAFEELSDFLEDICDDDDRRRMLTDTNTNSGFMAILELIQFEVSSSSASDRNRLFGLLMKDGGLMSAVASLRQLQISQQQKIFATPSTTEARRRLLDDDDDDDDEDGSGFCPFEFFGIALIGGDDDDNIFAVILEELEELLGDDCDEEEFDRFPFRCALAEILNGDDDDDDDDGNGECQRPIIAFLDNDEQEESCRTQLAFAGASLDATYNCEGDNPCELSGIGDVPGADCGDEPTSTIPL